MSFTSIAFVVFLPLVFLLYWFVFRTTRWQNALLVCASLLFYGWSDWRFLGLLLFTAVTTQGGSILIERTATAGGRRGIAATSILLNLGVLIAFKYYNFFVDNLATLLQALGMQPDLLTLQVILPLGISFYTFQAIGYTVDVYRRTTIAEHNPLTFMAFLFFFPQLVAGPIERSTHLLPQIQQERRFDRALAVDGLRQMLWGYVKKVVVADSCGLIVNQVWDNPGSAGSVQLLIASLLFACQIYGDFSGYSDIAIGCAKLFGIRLSRNFAYPFFATTMRELWRRWHMSLMSWFRDYVYIPMGGSRCKTRWHNHFNLLAVFLLSGLWHGANWTFILWGAYNGLLVMLTPRRQLSLSRPMRAIAMAVTTTLFALGLIVFRAPDLQQFGTYVAQMFSASSGAVYGWHAMAYCVAMLAIEWVMRSRQHGLELAGHGLMHHRACRWLLYYALVITVVVFYLTANHQTAFIYFRF